MSDATSRTKTIKFSHLLNIILLLTLIGTIIFGYFYYKQLSVVDVVEQKTDITKAVDKPEYLYTIYGANEDRMAFPSFTYVDDKTIYVTDTMQSRILVFDYNGKYQRTIGPIDKDNSIFSRPGEIAVYNDRLYVTDSYRGKVFILGKDGKQLGYFAEKQLSMPYSIRYKNEKFYIVDAGDSKVKIFDPTGKLLVSFGGAGREDGKFRNPNGINVDDDGTIYVADSNNFRVQLFNSDGTLKTIWISNEKNNIGGFTVPRGISFDKKGYVWIANTLAGGVSVNDKTGKRENMLTTGEAVDDPLTLPNSTFIDSNNRLYVTAHGSHRVLVYQLH